MEGDGQKASGGHPNEIRQVRTEKVVNVWGSVAGAGSDFFHLYRSHRNTEMNRLKEMDEEEDERLANEELQQTRERRSAVEASKTAKRAAKRKRKAVAKSNAKSARALNKFKNDGTFCAALLGASTDDPGSTTADKRGPLSPPTPSASPAVPPSAPPAVPPSALPAVVRGAAPPPDGSIRTAAPLTTYTATRQDPTTVYEDDRNAAKCNVVMIDNDF